MKCVLVGGGTGFIGRALQKQLLKANLKPVVVTRKPRAENHVSWDELSRRGLPSDCIGAANLAGATIGDPLRRWTEQYKKEVYSSRIETTKILSNLFAKNNDLKRVLVTASGVGYYPPHPTEVYTENSVVDSSTDFFTSLCRDWESAGNLPATSIHRRVIIRTGVVLGRDGGMIKQIYLPFLFGLGGRLASGQQPFPWIHIEDIVGIYMHALTNEAVSGVLNGVAPDLITNEEFTRAFGRALNRPTFFPMPECILSLLMGKERATVVITGQRVKPERTLTSGYQFKYADIRSATKQLVN